MLARSESVLLLLPPLVLCAGAVLQVLLARFLSSRGKGILAAASAIPALIAVLLMLPAIRAGAVLHVAFQPSDGPLALVLHADALSALFALMGTLLGAIVLLYSIDYMARDPAATRFYATMLVFIAGFVALVYCANLFFLYLCWEVIGLCSFSLVGFWYLQREAVAGARKVLLMTHIAGYGLLAAVLILYRDSGTAIWTDPSISRSFSTSVFLLMLVALLAKSVQVPLHTWIPDAMAAPTPVSSLLHAACYVTAGVYLAARMHSFAQWPPAWNAILIVFATITMIVGVMYALVQSDLKRMLAFSTVSQIGYMLLGIAIGTPLGLMAGLLHCLNHGFFKGGLFLNAGAVQHAAGTRDMNCLGGLAGRMPRTTLCWLVGAGNMAGIPLLSGFVSKWMLYTAALQAGWPIPAAAAWMVSLGTVFLCVKATSAVFLGPATHATREAHEVSLPTQWAMGCMALGGVVLGLAPQIPVLWFFHPMLAAMGLDASIRVTWFGLFTGAGTFSTAGGLVLAMASLLFGGAIFALARFSGGVRMTTAAAGSGGVALGGSPGDVFTGGEPLWDQNRLTAEDFSRIFAQNWQSFFHWSNVDTIYRSALRRSESAARLIAVPVAWLEKHALVVLLAAALGMTLIAALFEPVAVIHGEPLPAPIHALLIAACCLGVVSLACASTQTNNDRWMPLQIGLIACFALGGMIAASEWLRFGLMETAALLCAWWVWKAARSLQSKLVFLVAMTLSGVTLALSQLLSATGEDRWSHALLLTSVLVKFAAIPFCFWLLRIADELPAPLLGFILAIIDMAAIYELLQLAQAHPSFFVPETAWAVFAVLTSVAAALLMMAQRSMKRLLVLSSIEDLGFLILGISSLTTLGHSGVVLAASSHAMAKSLLFICIASPEYDRDLNDESSALAARYPVSAFGFLVGMLAILGVPPLLGYAGRWRLYETALKLHPVLLAGFILASILALIAYVKVFTETWWGEPRNIANCQTAADAARWYQPPARRELVVLRACIVLLSLGLLAAGLWPNAIAQALHGGRP
jgi:formate hydrogenlyase subunit 3/multisubunit Na+/H+ antiporter MnhD subunit